MKYSFVENTGVSKEDASDMAQIRIDEPGQFEGVIFRFEKIELPQDMQERFEKDPETFPVRIVFEVLDPGKFETVEEIENNEEFQDGIGVILTDILEDVLEE